MDHHSANAEPRNSSEPPLSPLPRVWPALVIVALQVILLIITVTPQIDNFSRFIVMMAGPLLCVLLFVIWLLAASRLRVWERLGLLGVALLAGFGSGALSHTSMGTTIWIYGAPLAMFVMLLGLISLRRWSPFPRFGLVSLLLIAGWSSFLVARLDGFDGSYWPEFRWRWTATPEERLLASGPWSGSGPQVSIRSDQQAMTNAVREEPVGGAHVEVESTQQDATATAVDAGPLVAEPGDWIGFRGPLRDSRVREPQFLTDWSTAPPRELWRITVGPAWSAFTQVGTRLYTQEQRGSVEIVACYDAETGKLLWTREDTTRFSDMVAGPGPRATPTFAEGRLYTLGARAWLNCLDARDGRLLWQRDLMSEVGARLPVWGFSGSPLILQGHVIVYAGGNDPHGLVAYDALTGEPKWQVPAQGMNFSSAQAVTIDGVEQALFTMEQGLVGLEPSTGRILWQIKPEGWNAPPMVQPQAIGEHSILVALGDGVGIARVEVEREETTWKVAQAWSSRGLKPAFNDFVYHQGFIYGFDQHILSCLEGATGQRKWKQGRYGFGQLLLLESSQALLVLSESGDVAVVASDPTAYRELARFTAIRGKTWNHPIVFHDRLVVRNGEEATCFQLPVQPRSEP